MTLDADRTRWTVRSCDRPGCAATAVAVLTFSYVEQLVVLEALGVRRPPQAYDLCAGHAEGTRPPRGWELLDRRAVEGPLPIDVGAVQA